MNYQVGDVLICTWDDATELLKKGLAYTVKNALDIHNRSLLILEECEGCWPDYRFRKALSSDHLTFAEFPMPEPIPRRKRTKTEAD